MTLTAKFYGGNTGAKFAQVWGRNHAITGELVDSYTLSTYIPNWIDDTYITTKFNNTLDAGNISTSIGTIQNWLLYRKEQTSDALEYIDTLSSNTIQYFDFKVLNNKVYQYYLFAKGTTISSPITTVPIQSDYYGWFLIDIENNKSYQIDIEFKDGSKQYVADYTEQKVNNDTNIFELGKNNYVFGSIDGILSIDNLKQDIENTNELLSNLKEFIHSDRIKILKGRRSEIYNVLITDYKETIFNSKIGQNIYKISFKYKEVGDV